MLDPATLLRALLHSAGDLRPENRQCIQVRFCGPTRRNDYAALPTGRSRKISRRGGGRWRWPAGRRPMARFRKDRIADRADAARTDWSSKPSGTAAFAWR